MKKTQISDFWFYKLRYQITYGTLFLAYLAIIFYTIFIAPNGLTTQEINSATLSANFSISNIFSSDILNAPFRILQNLSISIFGLSNFSIKLPAILISIATIFAIIKLSHAWFERGTATLAAILAIASSQFFFLAQNGAHEILYVFYPILLILSGREFLRTKKLLWSLTFALILALSFYTPLTIYVVLAAGITILAHPRLRFAFVREAERHKFYALGAIFITIFPLIIAIFKDFSILKTIFGIPNSLNIPENFSILMSNLFSFSSKYSSGVIAPIISPPVLILIAVGAYFAFSEKHTTRSYLINIWSVILFFVCLINPKLTSILLTPILILTISGLQSLIKSWYVIFPMNPYARVLGLIPITFFVVSFLGTSLNNFRQNYSYSPEIAANFNQDLKILLENSKEKINIITSKSEKPFFQILEKQNRAQIADKIENQGEIFITKAAFDNLDKIPESHSVSKILVSSRAADADRFYILKKR